MWKEIKDIEKTWFKIGPKKDEIVLGDWSECRPNRTMKRSVICERDYCLTYVEPCVYTGTGIPKVCYFFTE